MSVVLIDGNSVGFAAAATGKDQAGGVVVGAIRSYIERVHEIKRLFPGKVFVLWDGRSWRFNAFPSYKSDRDKNEELVKLKSLWVSQRKQVGKVLHLLGVTQILCDNYEADDLAPYIIDRVKGKVTMITGDKDWAQLYERDRVKWVDLVNGRRIEDDEAFETITKFKTPWDYVQAKALMGDGGDSIPSVGDFGEKAAQELLEKFGDVASATNRWELDNANCPKVGWRVKRFLDTPAKQDVYRKNLALVNLRAPTIPAPVNMRIVTGNLDVEGFTRFCRERAFSPRFTSESWLETFRR